MLGYEMSTSFTERMDADDAAKKDRRSHHKSLESERRRSLKEHFRRLSIMVSNPPTEAQCLKIAIMCIKNLKDQSTVLSAERDWLLLENRELVERLQELRVPLGLYSKLPRWEDGRVLQDWRDSKWDVDSADEARKSGSGAGVHGHEAYINRRLENVRKKKMQLHAWYKSRNHYEIQGEKGGWCSNSLCPAAPHRIQEGRRPKGDTWFIHPEQAEQPEDANEDDGWREDDDKMMLSGTKCPAENLHRSCTCASTVDRTASPSSAAVKFKLAKHVPMTTKNRKNNSVVLPAPSIANSKTHVGKDTDKVADTSDRDSSGFIRPAQPIGDTKTSAVKDTDEVADTTKVVASALGNLLELDPEDLSLSSRKQLYVIQIGKKGETQKISTADGKIDLDVSLVPLRPGKAVMIYKPETGEKVQVVPVPNRSRQSLPTETVNSHQVVSGSVSTVGPNSHQTGKSCVGQQVVSGSADIVQGRPDYARHSLPTETLNSPQVVSGSVRTVGPNSYQTGKSCVGPQVVSGYADIAQGRPRVNINQGQNISGSAGLIDQNLGMMQENVSTVSELAGVGHSQRTVTLNKPHAFPVSVCTTSRNTPKEMIQGDGTVVWGPAGDEQCQYRVTLSNSQVVYGSVRTVWPTSYETGKSCVGPRVVSGPVNIAQGRPTVNEPVQNRARHSLPTETNSPQVVSGSYASTIGPNFHQTANSRVGPQVVSEPTNSTQGRPTVNVPMPNRARHSLPTETFNIPQVVSGSSASTIGPNSHQMANSHVCPQVVSGPVNITQGRPTGNIRMPNGARHSLPTETVNSPQVVSGSSAGTIGANSHETGKSHVGLNILKEMIQGDGRPAGVGHRHLTVTLSSSQVDCGSVRTVWPTSHQTGKQHTAILNNLQALTASVRSTSLNTQKEKIQGDNRTLSGPTGVQHGLHAAVLNKPQAVSEYVGTTGQTYPKLKVVDGKVAWESASYGQDKGTSEGGIPQLFSGLWQAAALDPQNRKAQASPKVSSGNANIGYSNPTLVIRNVSTGHSKPTVTLSQPQAVRGLVSTKNVRSRIGRLQTDGSLVWESASVRQGKPTEVLGNTNIGQSKPTVTLSQPQAVAGLVSVKDVNSRAVTTREPQVVFGSMSTTYQSPLSTHEPRVVFGSTSTTYQSPLSTCEPQVVFGSTSKTYQSAVTTCEPQEVFGSTSTTCLSSLKDEINTQVVSEHAKSSKHAQKSKHAKKSKHTKPVYTPRKRKIVCRYLDCKVICGVEDIPQDQHTVNVSRHDPHYSVGPVNLGSTDEGAKVDAKMGPGLAQCTTNPTDRQVIVCQKRKADGKVLSACSQAAVTQSAPHAVCGPVSSTGLDFRKGNTQDISMVSRQPSGSYCQPTATHTSHQVDPWARNTGDLASGKGKAQASEDTTEEADESGSPISCMICDEPFNSVAELQSHLIDSHAS